MASSGLPSGMKDISQDEVSKLTRAMKDPQFRDHMEEYVKEISDPAHRKEYLQYLAQLEAKGEMPEGHELLRCEPGCCVKTSIRFKNGQVQKCFINIVHSDRLEDATVTEPTAASNRAEGRDSGSSGQQVQLPYSLSPPRPDRDLKDQYCMTCDFAVSTGTFQRAVQQSQFMKMLVDTAAEGLASKFLQGHEEVKKDFKLMQRMACKGGTPMPMSVRSELLKKGRGRSATAPVVDGTGGGLTPSELREMRKEAKATKQRQEEQRQEQEEKQEDDEEGTKKAAGRGGANAKNGHGAAAALPGRIKVPVHKLVHSGSVDLSEHFTSSYSPGLAGSSITVPQTLKLSVELPGVRSASELLLEVSNDNVVVEDTGQRFYLDLALSYIVDEQRSTAKFDKAKQVLNLELPVVPKAQNLRAFDSPSPSDLANKGPSGNEGALSEGATSSDEEPPAAAVGKHKREEAAEPPPDHCIAGVQHEEQDDVEECVGSAAGGGVQPPAHEDQQEGAQQREQLEFDAQSNPLMFVKQAAEDISVEHEAPLFIPALGFEGSRPGYCFTTGEQGLGYYRDSRQQHLQQHSTAAPCGATGATVGPPLLGKEQEEGVAAEASEANAVRRMFTLRKGMQRYLDSTAALRSSITAAPVGTAAEELKTRNVEEQVASTWYENRQNLTVFIVLPSGHTAAGVEIRVLGQQLAITFCTRNANGDVRDVNAPPTAAGNGSSGWRRRCLRRLLAGRVDPQQWHADLEDEQQLQQRLVIVLRKVDSGDVLGDAVDDVACLGDELAPSQTEAASAGQAEQQEEHEPSAAAHPRGAAGEVETALGGGVGGGGELFPTVSISGDSAELDAGMLPLSKQRPALSSAASAPRAAVTANANDNLGTAGGEHDNEKQIPTSHILESAIAMGQGVLLSTRLMYELL